jgi:hypothetical protein
MQSRRTAMIRRTIATFATRRPATVIVRLTAVGARVSHWLMEAVRIDPLPSSVPLHPVVGVWQRPSEHTAAVLAALCRAPSHSE